MVEHQGQCQDCDPVSLCHHGEDCIIDQAILHGVENDKLIDGPDVDMLKCVRGKLSLVPTHSSFFPKVSEMAGCSELLLITCVVSVCILMFLVISSPDIEVQ